MKEERPCPYCQGSGNDPKNQKRICPICRGRKTIVKPMTRT